MSDAFGRGGHLHVSCEAASLKLQKRLRARWRFHAGSVEPERARLRAQSPQESHAEAREVLLPDVAASDVSAASEVSAVSALDAVSVLAGSPGAPSIS